METKYLTEKREDLAIAGEILRSGGTVIFPTETVYGLGANALDASAVRKIFAAKGRPSDNPLIVHIAELSMLPQLVREIPESAQKLIDAFWPGPLTLIFRKSDAIPTVVTGGMDTVAVRMPSQPAAKELLLTAGVPVAAPSANRSGLPSPTAFSHVKADMDGRVDAIIDGGDCRVGVESTVLDVSGTAPVLYRPGGITKEQIEELIGPIQVVTELKEGESPKSPGLKYKHYAPHAPVQILHGDLEQAKQYVKECCDRERVGVLVFDEFPCLDPRAIAFSLGSRNAPDAAAHRLFAGLRGLDDEGVSLILAPEIPELGVWSAVRNRLYRAAAGQVLDLSQKTMHLLLVCTGNTCRSPMAEGLMNALACRSDRPVLVSSAGICAGGAPASPQAVEAMGEKEIDISHHRSRQITGEMIEAADAVLTMTRSHARLLCSAYPQYAGKVMTLAQWAKTDEEVADPYGGTLEDYRRCRDQLACLIQKGWQENL